MGSGKRPFLFLILLLSDCIHAYSMLDPIDFLALQSIRKSLDDMPGSNFFSTWDFTSDPCNFSGVYCDGDKVVALNLGDPRAGAPGLSGRLNPSIGKLSGLIEFTVVPGRIMSSLPKSITDCTRLRFLAVSRNFLSGEIPEQISNLRSLETLDLSYNLLSGSIPPSLGQFPLLSNLILSHNRFSGSMPPFLSPSLIHLDLKHNKLSGMIYSFSLPSSLQYLALSHNNFTGDVDGVLSTLNRLNYLDLSMNRFTGILPDSIFSFPLTSLQLQRNFFTGRVNPFNQVSIPTVDLSYNRLTGEISPLFSSVQTLYLNNNRFIGRVPSSFVQKIMDSGIQILYLQHNYLTGIEINPTVEIPVSSSLCLQYNCMVPPLQAPCPLNAGLQKSRPLEQCGSQLRG